MPVRLHEVASVLGLVLILLIAKHVPSTSGLLPFANITGIVCFTFAIYLCLRLFQLELARIRAEE
ncbi:MAG: hypothetical protein ABIO40_10770 [Devosia sp.]